MRSPSYNKRLSASDVAYQELKRAITEWEYAPGEQLVEESLSKELQVSRTPLRQALYRLELEGLIIRQPNGRMNVAPITVEEVEEIYKVREVLEGLLAREATPHITVENLQRLEDILEMMRRSAEQNRKEDTVKYGSDFHQLLHDLSGNETAKRFLEQLKSRIERYRRISGYNNPGYVPMRPVVEHRQILNALSHGDPDEAEEAMRKHIRNSFSVAKETIELYLKNEG